MAYGGRRSARCVALIADKSTTGKRGLGGGASSCRWTVLKIAMIQELLYYEKPILLPCFTSIFLVFREYNHPHWSAVSVLRDQLAADALRASLRVGTSVEI
jgi:hypothetical protein